MKKSIALFIPCYIDKFYPNVALSTYKILKNLGYRVIYPFNQTCCGQPMLNNGFFDEAKILAKKFLTIFNGYDYIVSPSASCVSAVKYGYEKILKNDDTYLDIKSKIFEICEFLVDIEKLDSLNVSFNHKVGLHQSCHGLRELKLSVSSELNEPYYSKPKKLLLMVDGLELVELKRVDECCGFGGTFSINEVDISLKMGKDRILDHINAKAEYIVGYDSSCLMHLDGIIKKERYDIKTAHIVEILSGELS